MVFTKVPALAELLKLLCRLIHSFDCEREGSVVTIALDGSAHACFSLFAGRGRGTLSRIPYSPLSENCNPSVVEKGILDNSHLQFALLAGVNESRKPHKQK